MLQESDDNYVRYVTWTHAELSSADGAAVKYSQICTVRQLNSTQHHLYITLLVTFVQTMSLFATFDVPRSVIFQVLHFPAIAILCSVILWSCKFSAVPLEPWRRRRCSIVEPGRHKSVHQRRRRLDTECTPDVHGSCQRCWKQVALTLVTCFSRLRSAEMTTPSTLTCWLWWIMSAASWRDGKQPSPSERDCFVPAKRGSLLYPCSISVDLQTSSG